MQLSKVEINGLFGRFNHVIKIDPTDNLAIIIAPNGFGKTVSLKLIRAALRLQTPYLLRINFQSVRLTFSEGSTLTITRKPAAEGEKRKTTTLAIRMVHAGVADMKCEIGSENVVRGMPTYALVEAFAPWIRRQGPNEFYDSRTRRVLTTAEVFEEMGDALPEEYRLNRKPKWLTDFTSRFSTRLIEAQRIISIEGERAEGSPTNPKDNAAVHVVSAQAAQLAERIGIAVRQYAAKSQQLDQTFPARMMQRAGSDHEPDQGDIYAALRALAERRQELIHVGLVDPAHSVLDVKQQAVDPSLLKLLDIYVSDVREKYAVFDETYLRLQLLLRVLNDKFQFKQIEASQRYGMVVRSDDGSPISLTDLSSGEQNEIVLAYSLIFETAPQSIILIDEPEISLHVAWQKQFLDDLKQILSINRCTAIVATHSPQIIGTSWDSTNDFGGSVGE